MVRVLRHSFQPALMIVLAGTLLAGCQRGLHLATAERVHLVPPAGTISVYQLAGRLRLRVEQSSSALATLYNRHNRVRIFSGDPGRISVNGRIVKTGTAAVPVGGVLFVPRAIERDLRLALRDGRGARSSPPTPAARPRVEGLVLIDAGHGGKDTGAIGVNGMVEKSVNLSVALRTASLLRRRGVDARMTRADDTFIELDNRADLANRLQCKLFVSIHSNSFTKDRTVRGFDVFVANSASARSVAAAKAIGKRLADMGVPEHGKQPKHAAFRVLVRSTCPAVLVEMGFLSNRSEAAKLRTISYRRRLAAAIANGVTDFLAQ